MPAMSLQGSLASINLADILQLVSNSRQTGRFVITQNNGQKGYIYFDQGEIRHAECEDFSGEDAIFTLIAWGEGDFIFESDNFDTAHTVSRPITTLLMEAARRIDEWKLLKKKLGSVEAIPEFIAIDKQERRKITLSTLEWLIVSKINGFNTINTISRESGINIYDAARIVFGMIASGLIRLK